MLWLMKITNFNGAIHCVVGEMIQWVLRTDSISGLGLSPKNVHVSLQKSHEGLRDKGL